MLGPTKRSEASRLHWARSSVILVGDLMLTIAHQAFAQARVSDEHRLKLLDLLDATVTETMAGEYCDVGLADGFITSDLELVLNMTRMKTAAYTFRIAASRREHHLRHRPSAGAAARRRRATPGSCISTARRSALSIRPKRDARERLLLRFPGEEGDCPHRVCTD